MNKKEFIKKLANDLPTTQAFSQQILERFEEIILETLTHNQEVKLSSKFGKFVAKKRNPKNFYNVHSGKNETTPAKVIVQFKPSLNFKQRLNNKKTN